MLGHAIASYRERLDLSQPAIAALMDGTLHFKRISDEFAMCPDRVRTDIERLGTATWGPENGYQPEDIETLLVELEADGLLLRQGSEHKGHMIVYPIRNAGRITGSDYLRQVERGIDWPGISGKLSEVAGVDVRPENIWHLYDKINASGVKRMGRLLDTLFVEHILPEEGVYVGFTQNMTPKLMANLYAGEIFFGRVADPYPPLGGISFVSFGRRNQPVPEQRKRMDATGDLVGAMASRIADGRVIGYDPVAREVYSARLH